MGFFKEFFTEIAIRVKNPGKNKYCHPKYNEFVPRNLPNPIRRQEIYTPQPPVYTPPKQVPQQRIQPQVTTIQPKQVPNVVIQRHQDYTQVSQERIQQQRRVTQQRVTQQRIQQQRIQPKVSQQRDYIQPKRQRVQPDLQRAWLLD
jgi:hypothetical protein